jgi:hypothetical protein
MASRRPSRGLRAGFAGPGGLGGESGRLRAPDRPADARPFGRKLEAARAGQAQTAEFAHNAGEAWKADTLFHHGQDLGIPPGLSVDHLVGMQAPRGPAPARTGRGRPGTTALDL